VRLLFDLLIDHPHSSSVGIPRTRLASRTSQRPMPSLPPTHKAPRSSLDWIRRHPDIVGEAGTKPRLQQPHMVIGVCPLNVLQAPERAWRARCRASSSSSMWSSAPTLPDRRARWSESHSSVGGHAEKDPGRAPRRGRPYWQIMYLSASMSSGWGSQVPQGRG